MKKFVMTAIATTIITIAAVRIWDAVVLGYFGWYNYPDAYAYALVAICAFVGGQAGNALSKIKFRCFRKNSTTYISKELS